MTGQQFTLRGVARVLEEHGYDAMAEFLRRTDDDYKRTVFMYEHFRDQATAVCERLHRYEPPQDVHAGRANYRSPPESDG